MKQIIYIYHLVARLSYIPLLPNLLKISCPTDESVNISSVWRILKSMGRKIRKSGIFVKYTVQCIDRNRWVYDQGLIQRKFKPYHVLASEDKKLL